MKKQLLALAASALMAAQGSVWAQNVVYYSQDFQVDTKPAELTYYDGDGNELADGLVGTGLQYFSFSGSTKHLSFFGSIERR